MGQDAKKYTYRVRWSEEDGEYVATAAEFPSLSWLDADQVAALEGIVNLVDDVIRDMDESGEKVPLPFSAREYSGNVRLRIPPEQHRDLSIRAAEEGVSLNRLLCSLITRPATACFEAQSPEHGRDSMSAGYGATSVPGKRITASGYSQKRERHLEFVPESKASARSATGTERFETRGDDEWPEEM